MTRELKKRAEDWADELSEADKKEVWDQAMDFEGFVRFVVGYQSKMSRVPYEDLLQEAWLGMFQAIQEGGNRRAVERRVRRVARQNVNWLERNNPLHKGSNYDDWELKIAHFENQEELDALLDDAPHLELIAAWIDNLDDRRKARFLGDCRKKRWTEKGRIVKDLLEGPYGEPS